MAAISLSPVRLLTALALAALLAWAAIGLARVDADLGAPAGPDRVIAAIDADPSPQPGDANRARAILHTRPIDGRAYRVLAQLADARGDTVHADALYAIAVRRAPRDRATRAALADRGFARGDIAGALQQIDALLRVAPTLREPVLARLLPALDDDRLRAALAAHLATNPPWRGAWAIALRDPATPAVSAADLLARLAVDVPLTDAEMTTRIALLQRLGRDVQARQAWLASLPPGSVVPGRPSLLFDGGFEHPRIQGGYGWRLAPPPGAQIATVQDDALQGSQVLQLDFSGRVVVDPGLQQWLALPPGDYRLQAASRNATDATRPFSWRIQCRENSQTLLSLDLPGPSGQGWQHSAGRFSVPPDCPGQRLQLVYLGRSLADRQLRGSLQLDAISLQTVNPVGQ